MPGGSGRVGFKSAHNGSSANPMDARHRLHLTGGAAPARGNAAADFKHHSFRNVPRSFPPAGKPIRWASLPLTMVQATPPTIVNVGKRSTNYWVVSAGASPLLVDIGWPGTIGWMKANLQRMGIPLREIRYALATHYHIDHAGLAEELKREGSPSSCWISRPAPSQS